MREKAGVVCGRQRERLQSQFHIPLGSIPDDAGVCGLMDVVDRDDLACAWAN